MTLVKEETYGLSILHPSKRKAMCAFKEIFTYAHEGSPPQVPEPFPVAIVAQLNGLVWCGMKRKARVKVQPTNLYCGDNLTITGNGIKAQSNVIFLVQPHG